jgi:hypothetical protein
VSKFEFQAEPSQSLKTDANKNPKTKKVVASSRAKSSHEVVARPMHLSKKVNHEVHFGGSSSFPDSKFAKWLLRIDEQYLKPLFIYNYSNQLCEQMETLDLIYSSNYDTSTKDAIIDVIAKLQNSLDQIEQKTKETAKLAQTVSQQDVEGGPDDFFNLALKDAKDVKPAEEPQDELI